jgi:tRNA threonylcarbamoyladenosine biosynthesis protein TsaB
MEECDELFDCGGQYIIRFKTMSNTGLAKVSEPIILAVDTSSRRVSLSLSGGEEIIASLSINDKRPHSQTLFSHISVLLRAASLKIQDIDAFAAATGPGSFTGLRVGLAAVKGLADSLGKPCLGVDSLDLLALATGLDGLHLAMIDAGRGEVYCGAREVRAGDVINRFSGDKAGEISSVLGWLAQDLKAAPLVITGSGAGKYKKEVQAFIDELPAEKPQAPVYVFNDEAISASATSGALAGRACRLLKNNRMAPIRPHYVRPSDAEIKCKR